MDANSQDEQAPPDPKECAFDNAGESPSQLSKCRRRSAVGARGSPMTNQLICFIAQHRNSKTPEMSPLAHRSPFQGKSRLYRNVSLFRERISAFQAAFHSIQEIENMAACPEASEADRGAKTASLTEKEGIVEYQQSGFPVNLAKRRRLSSQGCSPEYPSSAGGSVLDVQIRTDADRVRAVSAAARLPEKLSGLGSALTGSIVSETAPPAELTEASGALVSSETIPGVTSPAAPVLRSNALSPETLVLRSVLKKPAAKLLSESLQEHCNNVCVGGTHPSLLSDCKEQKPDEVNTKAPVFINVKKRKRVTFGEDLSPEVFDASLPANTPLRKGGTPVRAKDSRDASPLLLQPDFDDKENLENIEPLQLSFAALSPNKASVSEAISDPDAFTSSSNQRKITSPKVGEPLRRSSKRKQSVAFIEETSCDSHTTEVEPCQEKRAKRRKSQEIKCTNRALPKKKQVSRRSRKLKGKGKKDMKKSLYGERDFASKKPLLSPIPELLELCETTPSVPGGQRFFSDDFYSSGNVQEVSPPEISVKSNKIWSQNWEDSRAHPEECAGLPGPGQAAGREAGSRPEPPEPPEPILGASLVGPAEQDHEQLCRELADALEQSLQSLQSPGPRARALVRRSSRLSGEGQGLRWVPGSPEARRRTLGELPSLPPAPAPRRRRRSCTPGDPCAPCS